MLVMSWRGTARGRLAVTSTKAWSSSKASHSSAAFFLFALFRVDGRSSSSSESLLRSQYVMGTARPDLVSLPVRTAAEREEEEEEEKEEKEERRRKMTSMERTTRKRGRWTRTRVQG